MSGQVPAVIRVRVVAVDPPFLAEHGVLFGLQDRNGVVDPDPASTTTEFDTEIEVVHVDGDAPDYRGRHVHGRKGDRFLYLSWGTPGDVEPFVMFARAKIKLADLPSDLLEGAAARAIDLAVDLQATNDRGQPASGTIRPPSVRWHRPAGGER